jgi:hypothetical protein
VVTIGAGDEVRVRRSGVPTAIADSGRAVTTVVVVVALGLAL